LKRISPISLKGGKNFSKLKRVALLHYTGPPYVGGVEKVIEKQGKFLVEKGYEVSFIVGKGEEIPGIEVQIVPEIDSSHPENLRIQERLMEGEIPDEFYGLAKGIEEKIKELLRNIDILIVHNLFTMPFNLAATISLKNLSRIKGKKFIAWCHDAAYLDPNYVLPPPQKEPWSVLAEKIEGVIYVTISRWRRRGLAELFNVDEREIVVIPNGIDLYELWRLEGRVKELVNAKKLLEADMIFFLPTRIVKRKNIEKAIEVIGLLKLMGRDARLLITAPFDPHNKDSRRYFERLKKRAEDLGVGEEVIFLSEYFRVEDVIPFYLLSDALFFPSKMEGFGIPLLEAGALHIPVLSASIPPLMEIGGRFNLYFFEPDSSAEKIATGLLDYLAKHPDFNFHREIRREYHWDRILERRFLTLIESLF
jgi:glycosyltransferase involved in cell wall biosynthesis